MFCATYTPESRLMPYLYKTAITAATQGIPTMRSMVLEFTKDKTCHYLDKQYMLGDSLLVAPIFNDESRAEYYLPQGIWTNFFTGQGIPGGGTWIEERDGCRHSADGAREFRRGGWRP